LHQLWSVGYQIFEFSINGVDGENGIFANVGVTMLKTGTAGWDKRFEQFGVLGNFLEEPEGGATDIFVWVLLKRET
jgi:hypothetical protein